MIVRKLSNGLFSRPSVLFTGGLAIGAVCVFGAIGSVMAASATGTTTVTIVGDSGSVGGEETTTTEPTPEPTTTTSDTSLENGGGATSEAAAVEQAGVTTFRPVPAAIAAPAEPAFTPTSSGGGNTSGTSGQATGPRLPRGAQPVGNLTGGLSAVAVTGSPNQHFGISLPGETVFLQGQQTTNIEGFVHNAGDTPAMNDVGRASFNVGAKVAPGGQGGDGQQAAPVGPVNPAGGGNYQGPVVITNPFMDVIISYN